MFLIFDDFSGGGKLDITVSSEALGMLESTKPWFRTWNTEFTKLLTNCIGVHKTYKVQVGYQTRCLDSLSRLLKSNDFRGIVNRFEISTHIKSLRTLYLLAKSIGFCSNLTELFITEFWTNEVFIAAGSSISLAEKLCSITLGGDRKSVV